MVIKIENIFKDYSSSYSHFILDIPYIEFETGRVVFLMGHNGSGKSVFLKILSGEINSDMKKSFKISCDSSLLRTGVDSKILRQNAKENLALELTVKQNFIIHSLSKGFRINLFPLRGMKEELDTKMSISDYFKEKANQRVEELSGGQQQNLAFYLLKNYYSKILLLDEFLSATDHATTNNLLFEAHKLAKDNDSLVIVVSHDMEVALKNADAIYIFEEGKFIENIDRNSKNFSKVYLQNKISLT